MFLANWSCGSNDAKTAVDDTTTTDGGNGNQAGTMLRLKQPIDRGDGKLVLEFGSTYFEVTPGHGARITSLQQSGSELLWLTGASNFADAFGSTFWPSPQNWAWPPPAEIDTLEYAATVDTHGVITAQGMPNAETHLKVSKRFAANLAREAVDIEYSMTNTGTAAVQWAPWEVTRVPATGLAFWPTGSAPNSDDSLGSETAAGHSWCDPSKTDGEGKLFADGSGGYLGYLLGDRLLLKQFEDQPASAAAPNEGEIEVYVNPDHSYVEVENQGAYASIGPGETVKWKVTWFVRQLPSGVTPTVGSADLIAFVAETLK